MANEAQIVAQLTFAKGSIGTQQLISSAVNRDVAGTAYLRNVQSVGTTTEALLLGDVGTPGYCLFHNLDPTNFITVAPNNTDAPTVKLAPGDWALFRFAAAAPFVKADTASCQLEYFLLPA